MGEWDAWIGRETRTTDQLDRALAARWLATFNLPAQETGMMPQGIHFALCTPETCTDGLGEDGHPARDESPASFLPPFPMPRRMWASSTLAFLSPISIGDAIERTSRIVSINEKSGSSGPLAFVDVEHRTEVSGNLAVRETQTLVYREAASASAQLSPPQLGTEEFDESQWDTIRTITPDTRLLFRYSALTFNTHRIHYDAQYACDVERYRGLVVHGPLTASLLLQLAASAIGDNRLRSFAFRGLSPAIGGDALHLAMREGQDGYEMGAFASDGRQVMKATATL